MDIRIETVINAPARQVWVALAHEFAAIDDWSSTVDSSREIRASEVPAHMTVAPGAPVAGRETQTRAGTFREVITSYLDEDMDLTFTADGLPKVFRHVTDRQRVVPVGDDQSKVVFDVHVDISPPIRVLSPLLSRRMAKTFGIVQADLKSHVESR